MTELKSGEKSPGNTSSHKSLWLSKLTAAFLGALHMVALLIAVIALLNLPPYDDSYE